MATRRLSVPQIKRRQRNVIEGIGTSRSNYRSAAERLGVSEKTVTKLVTSKPESIRKQQRRDKELGKLLTKTRNRREVASDLGIKRIRRYPVKPTRIKDVVGRRPPPNEKAISRLIEHTRERNHVAETAWAGYVIDNKLPTTSISGLFQEYRNGNISAETYANAYSAWKRIYKVSKAYAASYKS